MTPIFIDNPSGYEIVKVSGSKTPNFGSLVENNMFVPPLAYSLEIDKGDKTPVSVLYADQYWGPNADYSQLTDWGRFSISSWYNPLSEQELLTALIAFDNNMLLKLKGQSLPILMALKERKETASLIESFLMKSIKAAAYVRHPKQFFKVFRGRSPTSHESRRLNNGYKRLLKMESIAKRSKGFRKAVTVADAYLQYRFAWLPLISDISDLHEGAAQAMKKSTAKMAYKGLSKDFSFEKDLPVFFYNGQAGGRVSSNLSVLGHQKIFYSIDDAGLALYSQSQSVLATMWDSVPYSFVVDGLVNVSKYLECSNATLGLRFNSGYKTVMLRAESRLEPLPFWNGTWACKFDGLPTFRSQLSLNRQILTDFPVPKLEFPYESYLNVKHIADLGALTLQKLKRVF